MAALRVSDTEVAALKLEAWADVESLLRHESPGPGEGAPRGRRHGRYPRFRGGETGGVSVPGPRLYFPGPKLSGAGPKMSASRF